MSQNDEMPVEASIQQLVVQDEEAHASNLDVPPNMPLFWIDRGTEYGTGVPTFSNSPKTCEFVEGRMADRARFELSTH